MWIIPERAREDMWRKTGFDFGRVAALLITLLLNFLAVKIISLSVNCVGNILQHKVIQDHQGFGKCVGTRMKVISYYFFFWTNFNLSYILLSLH